jgi:hypothetical protein
VGEHSLLAADGEEEVGVAAVLTHPDYNPLTSSADLALVTLQAGLDLGETLGLLCLPAPGAAVELREAVMVRPGQ